MKYIRMTILLFLNVLFLTVIGHAQVGLKKVGQSTMNFQLVSVSPRASAMGEAIYTFGSGADCIFFNPAGIAESGNRFDIKFYMTRWIADIDYMAGAAVWRLSPTSVIGFHALSVDYGTIYGTSLLESGEEEIYLAGYKETGIVDNIGAYSVGLSYGMTISTQFFAGVNIRIAGQSLGQNYMSSGLKNNDASKVVFDAGIKYNTGLRSFQFGMAIRNFSSNIKRERIYEQLPLLFVMGMGIDIFEVINPDHSNEDALLLAIDFMHPNNFSERMNVGLEYKFKNMFYLRGGYQGNQDLASWSAGLGVNSTIAGKNVIFDYSYSNFDIFDGVNRLSVGFNF